MIAPRTHNEPPLADRLSLDHQDLASDVETIAVRANAAPQDAKNEGDVETFAQLIADAKKLFRRADDTRKAAKEPHLRAGQSIDQYFGAMTQRLDRIAQAMQSRADAYMRIKAEEARRAAAAKAQAEREEAERQRAIAARAAEAGRPTAAAKAEAKAEQAAEASSALTVAAAAPAAEHAPTIQTSSGLNIGGKAVWTYEITDYAAIPLDALRAYIKAAEIEGAIKKFVVATQGRQQLAGVRIFETVKASIG